MAPAGQCRGLSGGVWSIHSAEAFADSIHLWRGGYEARYEAVKGLPLGPYGAIHARVMSICVILLERLGYFSEAGDPARWAVYIELMGVEASS